MDVSNIFLEQRNSTPRPMKLPTIKAVSSTPNQENCYTSKISRSVSTQTVLTLDGREFEEMSVELKSFCVPDEGHLRIIICDKNKFSQNSNNESSSPGNISNSKMIPFEKTPVQSKPSVVRKMSLRSKTMICSAIEKNNHRSFKRFNSMEEKRLFSNTFSLMPHPKTPTSDTEKTVHNPFEKNLQERLSKTVFSPDVFSNVISPSEESEYLRWTIDDISSINPVPIEEDFSFPSDEEDPEKEQQAQEEINRYFSETHIVLSPAEESKPSFNNELKNVKFFHLQQAAASTPNKSCSIPHRSSKHANTQTALTLPEVMPENSEDSLKSYFKVLETEDLNLSASNLRRKLFFNSEDEPPSPVRFELYGSPVCKWKDNMSPLSAVKKNGRHFTPVNRQQELSSPEMSPVLCKENKSKSASSLFSCKKTLHLLFPGGESSEGRPDLTLPSSQDTGYNTEESCSWESKPSHQLLASTPSHTQHI